MGNDNRYSVNSCKSQSIVFLAPNTVFCNGAGPMPTASARVREARRLALLSEMLRNMRFTHSEPADRRRGSCPRPHVSIPEISMKIGPVSPRCSQSPFMRGYPRELSFPQRLPQNTTSTPLFLNQSVGQPRYDGLMARRREGAVTVSWACDVSAAAPRLCPKSGPLGR